MDILILRFWGNEGEWWLRRGREKKISNFYFKISVMSRIKENFNLKFSDNTHSKIIFLRKSRVKHPLLARIPSLARFFDNLTEIMCERTGSWIFSSLKLEHCLIIFSIILNNFLKIFTKLVNTFQRFPWNHPQYLKKFFKTFAIFSDNISEIYRKVVDFCF